MCEAYDEAAAEAGFLAGLPPLVRAAASGDVEAVKAILASGLNPRECRDDDWSALHAAATRRHPQVVEALLAAGADVEADSDGFTPLLNAAGSGDPKSIAALLLAGANPRYVHPVFQWTPLSRAAEFGNLEVLELLLQAGADPDEGSPLIAAAEAGSLACVRALVHAGADIAATEDGGDAAFLARRHGHLDVAAYLEHMKGRAEPES
jgi:ankyrin repeat protein